MKLDFVHLHVHSDYSVLDGACKVNELLDRCKEFNMDACALTDHGNIFGAIEFYKAAKARNIKPIIGCELYLAPTSRFDRSGRSSKESNNHFLVLCENEEGYHNLCKLSSLGYLEGYHYRPRIDDELLRKYSKGLIATSSCISGRVPRSILEGNMDKANAHIENFIDIFGKENFLIELMDHGMEEENRVNPILADMADKHGLTMIATNDCHYLNKSDDEAHDALLCVQTGKNLDDQNRMRFPNSEFYFKSPEEMGKMFDRWPEAVTNTKAIAERCNVVIPLNQRLIPEYDDIPEGMDKVEFLHQLVMEGLKKRYKELPEEFIERAKFEIEVIDKMQFVDYFLVVWDLIDYARKNDIPVGPGRGSGAGSLVAYALFITNIDPMRYQLLFERFLNPERVSMPDFDIDFCINRREEMIEYSRNKYGKDNVSQIITFGRMLAKNVIRNVGRVMGMPYGDVDRIAKLIPDELKITLAKAVEKEPELKRLIDEDREVAKLWRLASRLEGTINNCGTHAAGVVICDQPLTDHVALYRQPNSDTVATQAEMSNVEEIGLLKMDFLGLRNLTVIHEAVRLIKHAHGVEIEIDYIEPNDDKAYALLRSGFTMGIFQLESAGMRDLARRIGLQSLEEMSALVALYRPGPMQFIDTFIQNKFNPDKIKYDHPLLEPILKETYGIAVYQEQVMQIVQAVAGFSLGQADIFRRAMGKKKKDLMAEQRDKFIQGCKEHQNIDKKLAGELFDKIETFAGYGFNKSHSVSYAFVAYQTAYLKANYPVEFMSALLSSESGNLDKVAVYVEECRRLNIQILPPDVNSSYEKFTADVPNIRYGLGAIKNVGANVTEAIVAERVEHGPYKDIYDFCTRLGTRNINRRGVESLNKAGAFITTGWSRAEVEAVIDDALAEAQTAQRDRDKGQFSLFDMDGMEESKEDLRKKPELPEWTKRDILQFEKEMLGLYVSGHPLAEFTRTLDAYTTLRIPDLPEMTDNTEGVVGGIVTACKHHITAKGKMAFLTLETREGSVELVVFSDIFEQKGHLLEVDNVILISAKVSFRNAEPSLIVNDIFEMSEADDRLALAMHIRVQADELQNGLSEKLAEVLGTRHGHCDVYLHCQTSNQGEVVVHTTSACRVAPSRELRQDVEALLGRDCAWFSSGMGLPSHELRLPSAPDEPHWKKKRRARE